MTLFCADHAEIESIAAFVPPEPPPEVWGYSGAHDTEAWEGSFSTREEAIAAGRKRYGEEYDFYIVSGLKHPPSHYTPRVADVLGLMADHAYMAAGEASEGFPSVTEEDRQSLEELLKGWSDKHLSADFWESGMEVERIEGRR